MTEESVVTVTEPSTVEAVSEPLTDPSAVEAVSEPSAAEAVSEPLTVETLKRKMKLSGTVKRTELYGAFIDVGVGSDAILHVSQLGDRGRRISDVLKPGDAVEVWVDKVDQSRKQIIVTMIKPLAVEWQDLEIGQAYTGTVTRLENFGAFINIGAEKEGLVHISELSHDYIKHPSQAVSVGDEVQVQVLKFSKSKRRINLSIKALLEAPEAKVVDRQSNSRRSVAASYKEVEEEPEEAMPTSMEMALRRAMGKDFAHPSTYTRSNKKQRRNNRKRRQQQEAIINRTLELTQRQ